MKGLNVRGNYGTANIFRLFSISSSWCLLPEEDWDSSVNKVENKERGS